MKTFFVTGGAGFIGSHLAEELLNQDHGIRIFDDFSTGSRENLKEFLNLSNVEIISGSILDKNQISQSFEGIDGCFHMAAAVGVLSVIDRVWHGDHRRRQPAGCFAQNTLFWRPPGSS